MRRQARSNYAEGVVGGLIGVEGLGLGMPGLGRGGIMSA